MCIRHAPGKVGQRSAAMARNLIRTRSARVKGRAPTETPSLGQFGRRVTGHWTAERQLRRLHVGKPSQGPRRKELEMNHPDEALRRLWRSRDERRPVKRLAPLRSADGSAALGIVGRFPRQDRGVAAERQWQKEYRHANDPYRGSEAAHGLVIAGKPVRFNTVLRFWW
jgi:hypothetical protein